MTTFILKDPSAEAPTLIYLTHYFNGKRLKISTGEKIHPKAWNQEKCRPRANGPAGEKLNTYLDRMEYKVREAQLTLKADFMPVTPSSIRKIISGDDEQGNLISLLENTSNDFALKLLKSYPGTKELSDIDSHWMGGYREYLESKGYAESYIRKNLSIISEVLKSTGRRIDILARRRGYEIENIYLSEYELLKLYGIELPESMDKVRNRFLIGAFSGLRFSDSSKITHDSIRQGLIFDRNTKTGTRVVIPLHWVIEQIMSDHPGGLPPSFSNQTMNKYLKEIGRLAGIDDTILINKTKGGKTITATYKKYELITTHTARRSAITNMVLSGIPTQAIMAISGHKTEGSFQRYVKMSKESNALSLKDHPFFKQNC